MDVKLFVSSTRINLCKEKRGNHLWLGRFCSKVALIQKYKQDLDMSSVARLILNC